MAEMNGQSCPYTGCGCIGYGYVPVQTLQDTYDACTGLMQGTIFPELNLTMCEYGKICKQQGGGTE